jgi:hypothetical protein
MPDMALRAWQLGWLLAVLGTGAAADGVAPSSGSGPAASTPARYRARLRSSISRSVSDSTAVT